MIVHDEKVDAKILDLYNNLKVIGCPMTGLDHIDLEECKSRGIKVISLQGEREFLEHITSTAEHTIGLIVALLRNYRWALIPPYLDRESYIGYKLKGKKLLLIGGMGRVGNQVKEIAEAMGMDVYVWDTVLKTNKILNWIAKRIGIDDEEWDLKSVLDKFDIVSIHVPLQGNEGFFTKEMFESMKSNAFFINTSRSKVVEPGALSWALKNTIIAGAAVDFVDEKDLIEYNIGSSNLNLILTNHIAGVTHEDRKLTDLFIEQKVDAYIKELNDNENQYKTNI